MRDYIVIAVGERCVGVKGQTGAEVTVSQARADGKEYVWPEKRRVVLASVQSRSTVWMLKYMVSLGAPP